jgi:hypothetical protein
MHLGRAVGRSDDFHVLGYCPDLDEHERTTGDPDHAQYTFVVRYQHPARTIVDRLDLRLDALWQATRGPLLAMGGVRGVIEIDAAGTREVSLPQLRGHALSMWGSSDAHLFACGIVEPFAYYRRGGQWLALQLPEGTRGLYDVRGFHENEVYFVGEGGTILRWNGQALTTVPVPTTRYLTGIARLDDTTMCICGYQGTLLMGNRRGWRVVPTGVEDNLLTLAALDGKVYYGADDVVWSFDGRSAPTVAIDTRARWVSGLADGLVLVDNDVSKLWSGGQLTRLDTIV